MATVVEVAVVVMAIAVVDTEVVMEVEDIVKVVINTERRGGDDGYGDGGYGDGGGGYEGGGNSGGGGSNRDGSGYSSGGDGDGDGYGYDGGCGYEGSNGVERNSGGGGYNKSEGDSSPATPSSSVVVRLRLRKAVALLASALPAFVSGRRWLL
ncbi:PREDICTED: abscisic acid and environmental stress-inducible protein-like [Brassica oleracea var. oleracea]|uniref:abscisic acid and environmental stress-inducible protein-like n=1 Tax=Brassica oleracea var. oleracea TaxID=109376 RepID=UPI0006A71F44|nr:PREDICTED: abscisic acid and environmental stress-inducible protein-like [Brassica oleracea var. oleracea]